MNGMEVTSMVSPRLRSMPSAEATTASSALISSGVRGSVAAGSLFVPGTTRSATSTDTDSRLTVPTGLVVRDTTLLIS